MTLFGQHKGKSKTHCGGPSTVGRQQQSRDEGRQQQFQSKQNNNCSTTISSASDTSISSRVLSLVKQVTSSSSVPSLVLAEQDDDTDTCLGEDNSEVMVRSQAMTLANPLDSFFARQESESAHRKTNKLVGSRIMGKGSCTSVGTRSRSTQSSQSNHAGSIVQRTLTLLDEKKHSKKQRDKQELDDVLQDLQAGFALQKSELEEQEETKHRKKYLKNSRKSTKSTADPSTSSGIIGSSSRSHSTLESKSAVNGSSSASVVPISAQDSSVTSSKVPSSYDEDPRLSLERRRSRAGVCQNNCESYNEEEEQRILLNINQPAMSTTNTTQAQHPMPDRSTDENIIIASDSDRTPVLQQHGRKEQQRYVVNVRLGLGVHSSPRKIASTSFINIKGKKQHSKQQAGHFPLSNKNTQHPHHEQHEKELYEV
jgi:hypothetical protein